MDIFQLGIKSDNAYKFGVNAGFFAAFLMFSSVFYFIMNLYKKLPSQIRYSHVILFVIIAYLIGITIVKFKK